MDETKKFKNGRVMCFGFVFPNMIKIHIFDSINFIFKQQKTVVTNDVNYDFILVIHLVILIRDYR